MVPTCLGQSNQLFFTYAATREKQLRDKLVHIHTNLARKVAHRWGGQCSEPYEDLFQLAMIGLTKAVERFEPEKQNAFSSFAVPYIQGEILHFLRDHWSHIKVPRRVGEFRSKVRRNQRILAKYGREVPEEQIALALGCSPDKWRWTVSALDRKPLIDLEEAHYIPAPITPADSADWQPRFYSCLEAIEQPYQQVLLECFIAGLSIEQIAQRQGVDQVYAQVLLQTGLRLFAAEENSYAGD